ARRRVHDRGDPPGHGGDAGGGAGIMKRAITVTASAALAILGVACGTTRPPNQLIDARMAYHQASVHPGASLSSTDLLEAKQALDRAERAFADGDMDDAKNLAYIAHRKAITSQAKAETLRAVETKRIALAEL